MNTFNRYAAILGFALVSAQAHAVAAQNVNISFDPSLWIVDSTSNAYSYTDSGLTITSKGWSATAAGNQILFSFSTPVSLKNLTVESSGGTSLRMSAVDTLGATVGPITQTTDSKKSTVSLNLNNVFSDYYNQFAVTNFIKATSGFDKLQSLKVMTNSNINPVAQPVPDAATWMTMLAGLGLVGFAVKRRTRT